jgi:hypothetical protein
MAAQAKTKNKKGTRKKATRKKTGGAVASGRAQASAALDRLEQELPATLRGLSRRFRSQLSQLEEQVEEAQAKYRRQAARLLREGSHQLGRLEAQGERSWRNLNTRARQEILGVLRRLERFVETAETRKTPRRKTTRRKKAESRPKRAARTTPKPVEGATEEASESVSDLFQTPPTSGV